MSDKPNILLVSDTKNWGGWKRAEMIKMYLNDEFNFNIMDADGYSTYERKVTPNIFNIQDVHKFRDNSISGKDKEFLNINMFAKWLNNNKLKSKYDLIYFLFHTMLIKKCVKRTLATKQKVVTMVTVYPTIRPIFKSVADKSENDATKKFLKYARKCKAILANNQMSLDDLRKIYSGPSFIATRGVDPNIFYPTNDVFREKKHEDFTIAFSGKPNPEKGFDSIIQPACREAGVKLISNQRNFTNALSEDQMRDFYNSADAYIVASTMDGTPNTALEAAACGKPVLSNSIGNMPEFINKGVNGWLIPLKLEKYINRLRWMKNNQKKVWEMGKEARETVLREWTWEKVLNTNERMIFRKVINGM